MSYYEQAKKINKSFKEGLKLVGNSSKQQIIDAILWFGQVAKYRCRSNSAYDNFSKLVFEGIAELERKQLEGQDFEVLKVKEVI